MVCKEKKLKWMKIFPISSRLSNFPRLTRLFLKKKTCKPITDSKFKILILLKSLKKSFIQKIRCKELRGTVCFKILNIQMNSTILGHMSPKERNSLKMAEKMTLMRTATWSQNKLPLELSKVILLLFFSI